MSPQTPPTLKPQWFYILLALAERPLHGSAIEREVLELSGRRVRLWPVTLYGALDALCQRRLIVELDERNRPAGESTRKKYYRLTQRGRRLLDQEARHLAVLAEQARVRLKATP